MKRNRLPLFALMGGILLSATGCLSIHQQGYPVGAIYTGTTAPSTLDRVETTGKDKTGAKRGEACSMGILGLAAFGDASIDKAKKVGGITDVHSVEYRATAVLGFVFLQSCTVVHGN